MSRLEQNPASAPSSPAEDFAIDLPALPMAPVECPQSGLGLAAKRCFDLLFALPGFLLISPALLLIGLAIRCSYGSPVFFRHPRVGKGGRVFTLLKFRTMSDERGPDGALLGDHARITRLGRVIRQLSLDEFPQLLNVLKGDLSLVGPRPLLVRYWPRYTLLERARHRVLPGMTGWAQVNGRNAITWSRRFELDLWYVRNWSFALDLRILWLTASAVLSRRDVERSESVVMTEFMGTDAGSHPEPAGSDGRKPNQPGA